jgi:hypothetical protein
MMLHILYFFKTLLQLNAGVENYMSKFYVIITLILTLASPVFSTIYYVSNEGLDSRDGLSASTSWKTISYAASKARSGDTVLLNRGDVFYESVNLPRGVSLKAYGIAAALPAISGAERIINWSDWAQNSNVKVASVSHKIENLFVNGKLMRIARYPNSGWLTVSSNDNSSHVVSSTDLAKNPRNAAGYWNGCRMRWRHWSWYYDIRIIESYLSNGTMTLEGQPVQGDGNGKTGWGFYLDGKLSELDTAGEWFYDSSSKKVYVYPPGQVNFQSAVVEGAWQNKTLSIADANVEGIALRQSLASGIEVTGSAVIKGCRFEGIGSDSGGAAVSFTWDASDVKLVNCRFENNLNLAISIVRNPSKSNPFTVECDTFINTGAVAGYGGRGSWHAAGIIVNVGNKVHVQKCVFDTTGYAAILFGNGGNFAENNVIRAAMATLNDGAAIYTNCDSSTIRHNIILNSIGDWTSSGWHISLGHGIWPEFLSHFKNNVIDSNTCAFCNGNGIFLPNNFRSRICGNTLYGNKGSQMHIEGGFYTDDNLPLYDTVTDNIFYAVSKDDYALTYRPEYNYGVIKGNYYCNPYKRELLGQYDSAGWNVTGYTLETWKSKWAQADNQAKTDFVVRPQSPVAGSLQGESKLVINESAEVKSFTLGNGIYKTLDNKEVTGSIEVQPFSSIVLVHTGLTVAIKKDNGLHEETLPSRPVVCRNGILFRVPGKSEARIIIINIAGRVISRMLVSSEKSRNIFWNGRENHSTIAAAGIYKCIIDFYDNGRKKRISYSVIWHGDM